MSIFFSFSNNLHAFQPWGDDCRKINASFSVGMKNTKEIISPCRAVFPPTRDRRIDKKDDNTCFHSILNGALLLQMFQLGSIHHSSEKTHPNSSGIS